MVELYIKIFLHLLPDKTTTKTKRSILLGINFRIGFSSSNTFIVETITDSPAGPPRSRGGGEAKGAICPGSQA